MAYRLHLTGEQIRAARALARIEQQDLARRSGLSLETVKRLERIHGPVHATVRTVRALVAAFETLGVVLESFPDGSSGVRVKARIEAAIEAPPPVERVPRLHRLIYHSAARLAGGGMMRATLESIAEHAPRKNAALGVTGVLLACQGRFLQLLEGDRDAVRHIYGSIALDPRHHRLTILDERPVGSRQFKDWTLCCGLFPDDDDDLIGAEPSMQGGFHPDVLTPSGALGLLATMRELQRVEPRRRRQDIGDCALRTHCEDRACAA